ncbi:MAG: hypothetical protein HYX90_02375 [Chloroflexi bacterium]|nr:hypothetical protein [Chloroflexota bacterium]
MVHRGTLASGPDKLGQAFEEWTAGLDPVAARVAVFERVRDMPYAVLPESLDPSRYAEALALNAGSCATKHLLLADMYQRLGLTVLLAVYPFRWSEERIPFPPELRRLAERMPPGYHLACRVLVGDRLALVDATLDPPLKRLGLPVNETWDGLADTALPLESCGAEQLYHPHEAALMAPRSPDEEALTFYRQLNAWLATARAEQR